jgi:hypothetical protein
MFEPKTESQKRAVLRKKSEMAGRYDTFFYLLLVQGLASASALDALEETEELDSCGLQLIQFKVHFKNILPALLTSGCTLESAFSKVAAFGFSARRLSLWCLFFRV